MSESSTPIVIKIGGALLERADCILALWRQIAELHRSQPVVVVHGGGSQATNLARRLGHEPRMVHGRRVTTDVDLEIVKAAFGIANIELVASGLANSVPTVGITGVDGTTLVVEKRPPRVIDKETVDFGWVGDVVEVRPQFIKELMTAGRIPVMAPLGVDASGLIYNVNADTVAAAIASAVSASQLLLVTESGGVRRDVADAASIISVCSNQTFQSGIDEGWINAGMRTKLEVALAASAKTSAEVFIVGFDDLLHRAGATRVTANTPASTQAS